MRVQPRAGITIGIAVVYLGVVVGLWKALGVDYTAIGTTVNTTVTGIVVPVGVGTSFLVAATSYLGWWRPAWSEPRTGPRWLILASVLFALPPVGSVLGGGVVRLQPAHVLWLAVGVLLVGFSEEMVCRGVGLVGLRGTVSEGWAWIASCTLFALLHAANALFGQALGLTLFQVVSAFFAGTVLYTLRRTTGTLLWCVLLHALFDFGSLSAGPVDPASSSPLVLLNLAQYPAYALALVGAVFMIRKAGARSDRATSQAR